MLVSLCQAHGDLKSFETPYVVRLYKHMQIAKAKPCFTFVHPNRDATIDNTRWAPAFPPRLRACVWLWRRLNPCAVLLPVQPLQVHWFGL